jgi:hypothetical protein
MIVRWIDGKRYEGATAYDVVEQMRTGGLFTAGKSNREYMRGVSKRIFGVFAGHISHRSAAEFLCDLERLDFVSTTERNPT